MELINLPLAKRFVKVMRYAMAAIFMAALFPVVALAQPPSPLDPASPAARSIADLHNIILIIAALVFTIVSGLLIYSIVRFRRKSSDEPEPAQSFQGNVILETIWTVIPVGILLVLLVLTFQTFQDINPN